MMIITLLIHENNQKDISGRQNGLSLVGTLQIMRDAQWNWLPKSLSQILKTQESRKVMHYRVAKGRKKEISKNISMI